MRHLLNAAVGATILIGCAPAAQRAYVAPTNETITSVTEERETNPPAHLIFVLNHSTVPITVFSVSLHACENVKQRCEPTPVKYKVPSGGRTEVMRVTPANQTRGFSYSFGFSWHPDSASTAALAVLASSGDDAAQKRLAAIARADSNGKRGIRELSVDDFKAVANQVAAIRAVPESLVVTPGDQVPADRLMVAVLNDRNQVLGHTRWLRWTVSSRSAVQFIPPDRMIARAPGRTTIRFSLAEDAQKLLTKTISDVEMPLVIAYPIDPHAPVFAGRAVDADTKAPLACTRVALQDSAQNIVSRDRTGAEGVFMLQAPRPGTYQVRAETRGWSPAYGPAQVGKADEEKQTEYLIRFTEQLLMSRDMESELEHAQPISVIAVPVPASTVPKRGATKTAAPSVPIIQGVTLGGSSTLPILGIVSRVPPATMWIQFVVDSTGHVNPASIMVPTTASADAKAAIDAMLTRVRFSPAREAGQPVCELQRMQVSFSTR
jgi:hypothetical protein